jgi:hypothetical protein
VYQWDRNGGKKRQIVLKNIISDSCSFCLPMHHHQTHLINNKEPVHRRCEAEAIPADGKVLVHGQKERPQRAEQTLDQVKTLKADGQCQVHQRVPLLRAVFDMKIGQKSVSE